MDAPSTLLLLVGVDMGYTPYGAATFSPETTCETTRSTSLDPFSDDFGTTTTTDCVTAEGWEGAKADVGSLFPGLALGISAERERMRFTAVFTLGPVVAPAAEVSQGTLTPDLALGGDLSLEYVVVSRRFSFAAGALGNLRGFEAHGTNDGGDTRLGASARFGGGPTLSVGANEVGLLLRVYGVYTAEGQLGAGATLTWAPIVLPM